MRRAHPQWGRNYLQGSALLGQNTRHWSTKKQVKMLQYSLTLLCCWILILEINFRVLLRLGSARVRFDTSKLKRRFCGRLTKERASSTHEYKLCLVVGPACCLLSVGHLLQLWKDISDSKTVSKRLKGTFLCLIPCSTNCEVHQSICWSEEGKLSIHNSRWSHNLAQSCAYVWSPANLQSTTKPYDKQSYFFAFMGEKPVKWSKPKLGGTCWHCCLWIINLIALFTHYRVSKHPLPDPAPLTFVVTTHFPSLFWQVWGNLNEVHAWALMQRANKFHSIEHHWRGIQTNLEINISSVPSLSEFQSTFNNFLPSSHRSPPCEGASHLQTDHSEFKGQCKSVVFTATALLR